jgi:hypothetical protein
MARFNAGKVGDMLGTAKIVSFVGKEGIKYAIYPTSNENSIRVQVKIDEGEYAGKYLQTCFNGLPAGYVISPNTKFKVFDYHSEKGATMVVSEDELLVGFTAKLV